MSDLESGPNPDSYGLPNVGIRASSLADFWDDLPTLSRPGVRLLERLSRMTIPGRLPAGLSWLESWLGDRFVLGPPEVIDRPSGLKRGGLVAQLSLPSQATRVGVGVETPLAHAIVDHLLGFDRSFSESRHQLTPVEWGIWTFLFAKILDELDPQLKPGEPPAPWNKFAWPEMYLDRVGPDPFDLEHLGKITTICWTSRLNAVTGTIRLWLPEPIIDRWLRSAPLPQPTDPDRIARLLHVDPSNPRELSSEWRVQGGSVILPRGLKGIRVGSILPIHREHPKDDIRTDIIGIELILELDGSEGRFRISACTNIESDSARVTVTSSMRHDPSPSQEISGMSTPLPPETAQRIPPNPDELTNLPVTLAVELGRVNLPLNRLADLKPGDIVEMNRHKQDPVELTSNGRVVARGELVKIDTEIGVRITNVFF